MDRLISKFDICNKIINCFRLLLIWRPKGGKKEVRLEEVKNIYVSLYKTIDRPLEMIQSSAERDANIENIYF